MSSHGIGVLALAALLPAAALLTPRAAPQAESAPMPEDFTPPVRPKPSAQPVAASSMLVSRFADPAAEPAVMDGSPLSDAPRAEREGVLTGTLAEIEAQIARERRPRLERAPKRKAAARAGRTVDRMCEKECRAERRACSRSGADGLHESRRLCQAEYKECALSCGASLRRAR